MNKNKIFLSFAIFLQLVLNEGNTSSYSGSRTLDTKYSKKIEAVYINSLKNALATLQELGVKLPKNSKILEIGCRFGYKLKYLHETGFKNLYAVDVDNIQIKENNIYNKITFISGDILSKKTYKTIRNSNYNLIISSTLLQFYNNNDALQVLKRLNTILNKDGIVLLIAPSAGIKGEYHKVHIRYSIRREKLEEIASEANYKIISAFDYFNVADNVSFSITILQKKEDNLLTILRKFFW